MNRAQKKQQEAERKLTPEERRAAKKERKRQAYKAERAERKLAMHETTWQRLNRKHKGLVIAAAVIVLGAVAFAAAYFTNTGAFNKTSFKFINYDKYVGLAKDEGLTYDKELLNVTDDSVKGEIDNRINATGAKYNKDFILNDTNDKIDNERDYEAYIRKALEKQGKENAKNSLLTDYLSKCKMKKYPKKQLAYQKEQVKAQYENMAKMSGLDTSGQKIYEAMGMTEKEYKKAVKENAGSIVKEQLVVRAYAAQNGISVSASDYSDFVKEAKKDLVMTDAEFKKQYGMSFEDYLDENDGKFNCLRSKVCDALLKKSKAVEKKDKGDE